MIQTMNTRPVHTREPTPRQAERAQPCPRAPLTSTSDPASRAAHGVPCASQPATSRRTRIKPRRKVRTPVRGGTRQPKQNAKRSNAPMTRGGLRTAGLFNNRYL